MLGSGNWTWARRVLLIILLGGCSTVATDVKTDDVAGYSREVSSDIETDVPDTKSKVQEFFKPETLNGYIQYALKNSSEIKAAYESYLAATYKTPQVTSLPDPRLSYGYFIQEVETRVGPQENKLGVSQSFPWFGTLSLRGELSDAEAKAEFNRFLSIKNKLVFNVTKIYADLAYLHSAVVITEDTIELVKSWEKVLQERFRSGIGKHSDLVRVQVELGKLEDRIAEFRDLITPMEAAFNSYLNRETRTVVSIGSLKPSEALVREHSIVSSLAEQDIINNNPELAMLDALLEARKKGIQLAEKKYYPDFTLGVDYVMTGERDVAPDGGEDAMLGMLSMNIPIYWEKNRAAVREAETKFSSLVQMRKDKSNMLLAEFSQAQFDMRDSKRKIILFKNTLIPKADESIEASYTAYESGEVGFLDVLDSEQRLLDFQLSLSRAMSDQAIAVVKLFRLAGSYSELPSVENGDRR